MKLNGDAIPALFIPLLSFNANNSRSNSDSLAPLPGYDSVNASLPSPVLATGGTPTSFEQALYSHHHHHHEHHEEHHDRDSHDDEHHERDRRENHWDNVGDGEGFRRPRAGQQEVQVRTRTQLQEANECPSPPILSCSAQAASTDTCCVVQPGGVLVHTQFWDLNIGQPNSWGIHGLWPDKCSGAFYENCDTSREYSGDQITQTLQNAGQSELLKLMNTFWLSNDESPEDFWSHEWAQHGTCVSTLEPQCFAGYQTAQEVVPYFETVVSLFQKFDTYNALVGAGITPSSDKTYELTDLQDAVTSALGFVPDFVCSKGQLSSVQYYLNAQGPLQDGKFVASHATRKSSCPKSGIKWPPKTVGN